jgi:hypothetical protein
MGLRDAMREAQAKQAAEAQLRAQARVGAQTSAEDVAATAERVRAVCPGSHYLTEVNKGSVNMGAGRTT